MKTKLVLSLFVILLILALYEVKPISTYTDEFMEWTLNTSVAQAEIVNNQSDTKRWEGEGEKTITFNSNTPPYILTLGVTQGNGIFETFVYHIDNWSEFGIIGESSEVRNNTIIYRLTRKGFYKIEIISSGYKWYAKVE